MAYSVITTVLSGAASYALTDLETVKMELSIPPIDTSNDAWLTRAIMQVSQSIARHCKQPLVPELVQDAFDIQQDPYPYQTPGGFPHLVLRRWPALSITAVEQTLALNTPQMLVAGRDYRIDAENGTLLRLNHFTGVGTLWESIPVTVTYLAGLGALAQETGTVPSSAPYTVTVLQADTFSCDQAVSYAGGVPLVPVTANPGPGQYSANAGTYAFNAADAGVALSFAYATANIPEDLVGICLRLITARFRARGRDPSLIQQDDPGLGTQRFWFGGAPGQKGPFPPDITAALDEYRVPTVV